MEPHVFVDAPEDAEFARSALDTPEQTCSLHALCRPDVDPTVEVERIGS